MTNKKHIDNDPIFLLRGDDDEIYYIDDIEMINTMEAKVRSMKGQNEDEITEQLLIIVNPDKYGKR